MSASPLGARRTGGALLALLSAACAGATRLYQGPPRPAEEIVQLSVDSAGMDLDTIDDVSASGYRFELLPGPHEVHFEIRRGVSFSGAGGRVSFNLTARCRVAFTGEAGHAYRLEGRVVRKDMPGGYQDVTADAIVTELTTQREFRGGCTRI